MKGKMKRFFAVVLSAAMVLSAFGCGQAQPAATTEAATEAPVTTVPSAETATDMAITLPVPTTAEETTAPQTAAENIGNDSELQPVTPGTYDPKTQKLVALTFDDGPDTSYTKATTRIVDLMERYGGHCTFFATGQAIKEWFPDSCKPVMKKAVEIGCEYATHTYSHANLNTLDAEGIKDELRRGIDAIEKITGKKVTLLRPPYGNAKESVAAVIDMPMIQWDLDTLDWKTKDAQNTFRVVKENIHPGCIVLMHDIYRATADAADLIVPWLVENGYTMVTVTELYNAYGIPLEGHKQYFNTDIIQ